MSTAQIVAIGWRWKRLRLKEHIEVYICYKEGNTVCICPRNKKKCNKKCVPEVVERDIFRGWEDCFNVDKYGKSKQR